MWSLVLIPYSSFEYLGFASSSVLSSTTSPHEQSIAHRLNNYIYICSYLKKAQIVVPLPSPPSPSQSLSLFITTFCCTSHTSPQFPFETHGFSYQKSFLVVCHTKALSMRTPPLLPSHVFKNPLWHHCHPNCLCQ